MIVSNELADAIVELERIQTQIVAISERSDAGRKLDLVNLRRELAVQIGIVRNAAEKIFLKTARTDDVSEFRSLLSEMRRAVALHQANFPAVKLDEQGAEYIVSVKSVRNANARFMKWAGNNVKAV